MKIQNVFVWIKRSQMTLFKYTCKFYITKQNEYILKHFCARVRCENPYKRLTIHEIIQFHTKEKISIIQCRDAFIESMTHFNDLRKSFKGCHARQRDFNAELYANSFCYMAKNI